MHFCLQWQFFVLQPVRVINLPLIQHGEVAGKKMQMRKDKAWDRQKKKDVSWSVTFLLSLTADRCFD